MAAVKLGVSRQVVIPKTIHDHLKLKPGDYLDVQVRSGKVVLTPKTLVDKRIELRLAEGLEDIKKGRVYGPFRSAREMVRALHRKRRPKKA
jgi:AbrB family looped-hinge helix DNA binding protein